MLQNKDVESSLCRASALRIYGEYLSDTQSENLEIIHEKCFERSLVLLSKIEESKVGICERLKLSHERMAVFIEDNRIKAYVTIAKYSDRKYQQLNAYMKSAVFERKKGSIERNKQTADEMGKGPQMPRDMQITQHNLSKCVEIDKAEIKSTETEHDEYLKLALFNYVKACILQADPNNSLIFRIISLWISNKKHVNINKQMQKECPNIGSYKFMIVLPQLAVRISNTNNVFSNTICEILGTIE